ncbi:MAG: hypothetical protein ACO1PB_14795 [Ramlibacter sp.]
MNHCWPHRDALTACNEGRHCEASRRLTFLVLFSRHGGPGMWLTLVASLWALVAATTLGNMG